MSNSATRAGESEQPSVPAVVHAGQAEWIVLIAGFVSWAQVIGSEAFTEQWLWLTLSYSALFFCGYLGAWTLDMLKRQTFIAYTLMFDMRTIARATTATPAQVVPLPGATKPDEQKGPQ